MKTEEEQKMRNTPETDATYQFGMGRVSVNFARRLERERDEARMALRELLQLAEGAIIVDTETIARWRKSAVWEGEK